MKAKPAEVGRLVISRQGHDSGRWYCVTAVLNDKEVLCCDGTIRKLDKPKKKKTAHLTALPMTVDLTVKGASGGKFDDSDLFKAIKASRAAYEPQTGWPHSSAVVRDCIPGSLPESSVNCDHQDLQKEECALVEK